MDYYELLHILIELLTLQYQRSVEYLGKPEEERDPVKTHREEGAALACHVIIQSFLDLVLREEETDNASNN